MFIRLLVLFYSCIYNSLTKSTYLDDYLCVPFRNV